MTYCMRSLMLLVALPALVFALGDTAKATDRFDVIVDVVSFKSTKDMDPSKGNANDEYFMNVHVDVPGAGRRSLRNYRKNGAPMKTLYVNKRLVFRNIKEPHRSERTITVHSDVSEQDIIKLSPIVRPRPGIGGLPGIGPPRPGIEIRPRTETKYVDMGGARSSTSGDMFKEADRARNDTAVQTLTLYGRYYRMEVRVTVVEVD